MTYIQNRNRNSHSRRRLLFLVVLLLLIFGLVRILMPGLLPNIWHALAKPFWRLEFAVESGAFRSSQDLLAENEELKRLLLEADIRLENIRAVEAENLEIKNSFGRLLTETPIDENSTSTEVVRPSMMFSNQDRLLSAVLKRPPLSRYDILIIDVGLDHDLAVGDMVYAPGNILIGKVSEPLSRTAKVTLFSSPGESHEVLIGSGNIPATAIGQGGGFYKAEVSRDLAVLEGDQVISPSISDRSFGVIHLISEDPAQAFKSVSFAPTVNIYQLKWVLVEKIDHSDL